MTKLTYSEQLRHPMWQRKRLEILNLAGWQCQSCYCQDETLHVHHKRYVKGRMAWEYSPEELIALCETCHDEAHREAAELQSLLCKFQPGEAACLLHAYAEARGYITSAEREAAFYGGSTLDWQAGRLAGLAKLMPTDLRAMVALIEMATALVIQHAGDAAGSIRRRLGIPETWNPQCVEALSALRKHLEERRAADLARLDVWSKQESGRGFE